MSSGYPSVINPGPVAHPARNTHRVGASNHHQTGSGENSMVGTTTPAPAGAAGSARDRALVEAVYHRVDQDTDRFLWTDPTGEQVIYSSFSLALLVAEIVTEHTNDLRAERDAADDAVLDLLHDLESGGGQ